ncbi:MAG: nucleoside hydrolase, partial [Aquabacterium sp.]
GNLGLPLHVQRRPETTPAWRFIVDTLHRLPGPVTLLAIGPLTNLALALAHDPSIAGLAREVVVMGGAFGIGGQGGNVTPVAEANILGDPHAADAVFRAPWPVTIVGLDVTHQVLMAHAHFDHLRLHGGAAGGFIWDCSRHYVGFYGRHLGVGGCYVHDGSAAAYVLAPQLFQQRLGAVRVVDDGIAMGQTIQALRAYPHATAWDGLPAQRVCAGVDAGAVLQLIRQTLCSG